MYVVWNKTTSEVLSTGRLRETRYIPVFISKQAAQEWVEQLAVYDPSAYILKAAKLDLSWLEDETEEGEE
jgi:hypothetical protein